MVVHSDLSLRLPWSTELVPGKPELHREILSQKDKIKPTNQKNKNQKQKALCFIWFFFAVMKKNQILYAGE